MKTRLNISLRNRLERLAETVVSFPEEQALVEERYKAAAPRVRALVEETYPPKDMKILTKYSVASVDDCIKLNLTSGGVQQFNFKTDEGPLVVKKTWQGQVYQADDTVTSVVADWVLANERLKEAKKARLRDYRSLIITARNLEEIEEIWPEAASVRPYAENRVVTVVTQDVIDRIKADVERRKKEEKDG